MQRKRSRESIEKYGISEGEYYRMFSVQNYSCGICDTDNPGTRGWAIDHDHDCCPSGRSCGICVRGILCFRCNMGLGLFEDDPYLFTEAADYLKQYQIWLRRSA